MAAMGARFAGIMTEATFDKLDALTAWAAEREKSLLDLAFAWLLGRPEVSSVIAGATRPEQVKANAAAGAWSLTPAEVAEVTALVK